MVYFSHGENMRQPKHKRTLCDTRLKLLGALSKRGCFVDVVHVQFSYSLKFFLELSALLEKGSRSHFCIFPSEKAKFFVTNR